MAVPSSAPMATPQTASKANQRQPASPMSRRPSRPKPSSTTGNAVPSLSPASPVSAKRSRSRSPGSATCTSVASTGSVGARMPPSRIAAPIGRPSTSTPKPAIKATVTSIETMARRTGSSQRPSPKPALIFRPEPNSESRATISASRSSPLLFVAGTSVVQPSQSGLTATPASRYGIEVLSGNRANSESPSAMTISNRPTTADHDVISIRSVLLGDQRRT